MLHCPLDAVFLKGEQQRKRQVVMTESAALSSIEHGAGRVSTPNVVLVRAHIMADALGTGTSSTVMGPVFTGRSTRVLLRICQPQSP
jgi:hypothetical protein